MALRTKLPVSVKFNESVALKDGTRILWYGGGMNMNPLKVVVLVITNYLFFQLFEFI